MLILIKYYLVAEVVKRMHGNNIICLYAYLHNNMITKLIHE